MAIYTYGGLSLTAPRWLATTLALAGIVGSVSILSKALSTLSWIRLYALRRSTLPQYRRAGAYALVTGSSSGIGAAFARELAAKGFNIVLHGRSVSKLEALISQLKQEYPSIDFRYVIADVASPSESLWTAVERIAEQVAALPGPLTVLVNNIGGMLGVYGGANITVNVVDTTPEAFEATLSINIRTTAQITKALLPLMAPAGSSEPTPFLILNVSSVASIFGLPGLTTYSGTKAFINRWSEGLAVECTEDPRYRAGEVLSLVVGETTEASGIDKPVSLVIPNARTLARSALHKVGCGQLVVVPHWTHALQVAIFTSMPRSLLPTLAAAGMSDVRSYWEERETRLGVASAAKTK